MIWFSLGGVEDVVSVKTWGGSMVNVGVVAETAQGFGCGWFRVSNFGFGRREWVFSGGEVEGRDRTREDISSRRRRDVS